MVNTNKIYNILKSITMVIFIFYTIRSCSYASINFTNFDEVNYNTTLENFYASVCENTYGVSDADIYNSLDSNKKSQFDLLYNDLNSTSFKSVTFENKVGVNGYIQIWFSTDAFFSGATINEYTIIHDRNGYTLYRSVGSGQSKDITGNLQSGWSNKWLYYNNHQWFESKFNSYKPIFTPILDFELATSISITDYMGYGQTNAFRYTYNNNKWLLGWCTNLDAFDEVVFKMIDLTSDRNIATAFKNGSASNMRLDGNDLQIDGYILYQKQPYRLSYDVYLDGDIVDSFYYNVVFMDPSAVINNGVVDSYGSGNGYNVQNSINELMDNSQVGSILQGFGSGDMSSKLGFQEYNNPFQDIIFGFAYNLAATLNSSGDVYFDYSMHGESPTRIYASYFTTPETTLKQFIRISMVFGIMFVVYNQFREIIEAISTARAPEVLHDIDADVYFYKM